MGWVPGPSLTSLSPLQYGMPTQRAEVLLQVPYLEAREGAAFPLQEEAEDGGPGEHLGRGYSVADTSQSLPISSTSVPPSLPPPLLLSQTYQNPTSPPTTLTRIWRRARSCYPQRRGVPCTASASWRSRAVRPAWRRPRTAAVRSSWGPPPGRTVTRRGCPSTPPTSATTQLGADCPP